jgi:hypothetical protein
MTQDELKLVLDALKFCHGGEPCGTAEAIAVIEKALAQPKQEPMAWKLPDKNVVFWEDTKEVDEYHGFEPTIPLYPHPQRTWVGLTDEEIDLIDEATWDEDHKSWGIHDFARAIEAKLKEKNSA